MKKLYLFVLCVAGFTAAAQPQNAFHFDGVDDYVQQTAGSASLVGKSAFAMACWVYPSNPSPAFPNFDGIIGYRNESNADFFILQLSATSFEARFRNSAGSPFTITSPTCQVNQWQHLALVYTGSQLRFYHNGTLSQSITASGIINNATVPFNIGRIPFSSTPFWLNGQVDEVGIWGRALSDSEVNCIYRQKLDTSMTGLMHYFPMDEGIAGGNNFAQPHLTDTKGGLNGLFYGTTLNGATSNYVTGTQQMGQFTDTLCKGSSYTLFGQTFNQPGTYRLKRSGGDGCDSSLFLTLVGDTVDVTVSQNRELLTAANTAASSYRWLNCQLGFAPIVGATARTFTATANGTYAVEIVENGCTDTSACFTVATVSTSSLQQASVRIYPNPGNHWLFIDLPTTFSSAEIEIVNIQGQTIKKIAFEDGGEKRRIEVSSLAAGTYYVCIKHGGERRFFTWVKYP
jgi:hypothetical protein